VYTGKLSRWGLARVPAQPLEMIQHSMPTKDPSVWVQKLYFKNYNFACGPWRYKKEWWNAAVMKASLLIRYQRCAYNGRRSRVEWTQFHKRVSGAVLKACPHQPHQATKLPKTATNCCQKRQHFVAVSGNNVAVFGDYSFGNNFLPFSATLLPGMHGMGPAPIQKSGHVALKRCVEW